MPDGLLWDEVNHTGSISLHVFRLLFVGNSSSLSLFFFGFGKLARFSNRAAFALS